MSMAATATTIIKELTALDSTTVPDVGTVGRALVVLLTAENKVQVRFLYNVAVSRMEPFLLATNS
jgi:hypothetical protein